MTRLLTQSSLWLLVCGLCFFSTAMAQQATFRFVNACPDMLADSIDIEVDYASSPTTTLTGLAYVNSSAPFNIEANEDFDINVYEGGTTNLLGTWTAPTGGYPAQDYVAALTGVFSPGKTGAGLDVHVTNFQSGAPAGQAKIEILHAIENLPFDVRFEFVDDGTGTTTLAGDSVTFTEYSPDTGALDLPAGSYKLRVSAYVPALTPVDSFAANLVSGESFKAFVIGDEADPAFEVGLYVMDNAGGSMFLVPSLAVPDGEIDELFVMGFNNSLGAYRFDISAYGFPSIFSELRDEPDNLVFEQETPFYDASLRLEDPVTGSFIDSIYTRPLYKGYPAVDTGYITFVYGDLQVGGGGLDTAYLEQVSRDPAVNPNGPSITTELYAFHAMLNAADTVDYYIYPVGSAKPASPTFASVAYGEFSANSEDFTADNYVVLLSTANQNDTLREYRFDLAADNFGVLFSQGDLNARSAMYLASYRENMQKLLDLEDDGILLHLVHDIDDALYSSLDIEIREPGAGTPLASFDGLDYRHAAPLLSIPDASSLGSTQLTLVLKDPSSGTALNSIALNDTLMPGTDYVFYLTKRENDTDPTLLVNEHIIDTTANGVPYRYWANGIENSGCQTLDPGLAFDNGTSVIDFNCDYNILNEIDLSNGVFDAELYSSQKQLPTAEYELDIQLGSQYGWILSGSLNDPTQGLYRVPITGGPFELLTPKAGFSVKSQLRMVNATAVNPATNVNGVVDSLNGGQIASVFGLGVLQTSDTLLVPAGNTTVLSFNAGSPGSPLVTLAPGVDNPLRGGELYNAMLVGDPNTTGYQMSIRQEPSSFDQNSGNYAIQHVIPGDNPAVDFRVGELGQPLSPLNSFLNFGNTTNTFNTNLGDVGIELYASNAQIDIASYEFVVDTGAAGTLVLHADTFPDPMLYRFPDGAGDLIPLVRDSLFAPRARMFLVHDIASAGNVDIRVVHPDGNVFASFEDVPFQTPLSTFELPSDSVFVIEVYAPGTTNLIASYNSMTEDFVGDGMAELGREYGILLNFVDNSVIDIEPWYKLGSPNGNDVALLGYNGMVGSPDLDVARYDVDAIPGTPGQYNMQPFVFNSYDQFEPGSYEFAVRLQSDPEPLKVYADAIPSDFQGILLLSGTYPDDYGLFLVPQNGTPYIPLTLKSDVGRTESLPAAIAVYPNPATHTVHVATETAGALTVYDMQGRVVNTFTLAQGKNTCDVSNLPSGLYVYKYESETAFGSGKLLIQR